MKKKQSIVSGLLSGLLWGSGQFFICKQRIKGLIFFAFQVIFFGIELFTGYWMEYFLGMFNGFSIDIHGGFFTRGIWGLITLGETARKDHSTMLLINGLIAVMVIILFLIFYIYNIRDAYRTSYIQKKERIHITSKQYFQNMYSKMFSYVVLTPIGILFLFIIVMPIICTVLIAFTNYNRQHLPPGNLVDWVGFGNLNKLFHVPIWTNTFVKVLLWTVIWAVVVTTLSYLLGLLQAVILNHKQTRFKRFFQTVLILPWAIPQMVSLLYFRCIFNGQFGPVNQFLMDMGIIDHQIPFLSDPLIAKILVISVAVWTAFPIFMVMLLGILSNMNKAWYEAATIDGATKWQCFKYITLPQVLFATAPLIVMSFAGNFNGFGIIFFLTEGGPVNPTYQFAGSTDILISWIYKLTLNQQMYSMAAIMSILLFIFVGAISFWNFKRTTSFKEM